MLPAEPKIFHGRESEVSNILDLFGQGTPRVAVLGAGGMGKTSLTRVIVHHADIAARYEQQRFFVPCDSAVTKVEVAALVIQHFSCSPPSLLILDNLETSWEPTNSRADIEEFLSLLTDVDHLALIVSPVLFVLHLLILYKISRFAPAGKYLN
jgi:Cdc6-like AAA superfamily ATPase